MTFDDTKACASENCYVPQVLLQTAPWPGAQSQAWVSLLPACSIGGFPPPGSSDQH